MEQWSTSFGIHSSYGVCVLRMATCQVVLVGCTVTSPTRWPQEVVYWHGKGNSVID